MTIPGAAKTAKLVRMDERSEDSRPDWLWRLARVRYSEGVDPAGSLRSPAGLVEGTAMRIRVTLIVSGVFAFAAAAALAADKPKLVDEERALQELRPLERHTYVLTLEAEWGLKGKDKLRPAEDKVYFVNLFFPDGGVYSHRVLGAPVFGRGSDKYLDYPERVERGQAVADPQFMKGEVRCLVPDYQLVRHGIAKGGDFSVVVSVDDAATAIDAKNVITQPIEIHWPIKGRPVQTKPVRTSHSPPEPPDEFPGK